MVVIIAKVMNFLCGHHAASGTGVLGRVSPVRFAPPWLFHPVPRTAPAVAIARGVAGTAPTHSHKSGMDGHTPSCVANNRWPVGDVRHAAQITSRLFFRESFAPSSACSRAEWAGVGLHVGVLPSVILCVDANRSRCGPRSWCNVARVEGSALQLFKCTIILLWAASSAWNGEAVFRASGELLIVRGVVGAEHLRYVFTSTFAVAQLAQ